MDLTSYRESSKKVAEFLTKVPPALLDSGERVALPRAAVAPFKIAWGKYWLNLK